MLLIPQTVTVRVTGLSACVPEMRYTVVEMDLKEYVTGALAAEWGSDWPTQSLRAGAVATKQFIVTEYLSQGYVWDCNWDTGYKPEWISPGVEQAVDYTWSYWIWNDGLVKTYFDDYPSACLDRGQTYNCLSQWETLEGAIDGYTWKDMLELYDGELVKKLKTPSYTTPGAGNP